ncbi:MAG: type II toxin-antitoxin system VapC family toxin [Verrucomicrobiota bacterium]
MSETVYIETTVVSYLVAKPSRDLVLAAHQEVTREWWEIQRPLYQCVTSVETLREASAGDPTMAAERMAALAGFPVIQIEPAIEETALSFLKTGAIPETMRSDAIHLAAAAHAGADYLLTWNCRHLANAHVLRRLEREAVTHGWQLPTVCTPLELLSP